MPSWSNFSPDFIVLYYNFFNLYGLFDAKCQKVNTILFYAFYVPFKNIFKAFNWLLFSVILFGFQVDSGHLKHVFQVFHHFGYVRGSLTSGDQWDVLWAHDYPFKKLYAKLKDLKPYQIVSYNFMVHFKRNFMSYLSTIYISFTSCKIFS